MKRILSIIITICLMLTVMPFGIFDLTASAEETKYTEGYYTYTVSNDEVTITRAATSINDDVIIPNTLGGYPVTRIGDSAFSYSYYIDSIIIPDSVTSIGAWAFSDCYVLRSITIPDSVISIGYGAFASCDGFTNINITDITAWCNIDFESYT